MNPKIYKGNGMFLLMNALAYASSFAVLSIVLFIFTHHWLVRSANLLLCLISLYYIRYMKIKSEIEIIIDDKGITYKGIQISKLRIGNYKEEIQWSSIRDVVIEDKEKGPIKIQTIHGQFLFWNNQDVQLNQEITNEIHKFMKKTK